MKAIAILVALGLLAGCSSVAEAPAQAVPDSGGEVAEASAEAGSDAVSESAADAGGEAEASADAGPQPVPCGGIGSCAPGTLCCTGPSGPVCRESCTAGEDVLRCGGASECGSEAACIAVYNADCSVTKSECKLAKSWATPPIASSTKCDTPSGKVVLCRDASECVAAFVWSIDPKGWGHCCKRPSGLGVCVPVGSDC